MLIRITYCNCSAALRRRSAALWLGESLRSTLSSSSRPLPRRLLPNSSPMPPRRSITAFKLILTRDLLSFLSSSVPLLPSAESVPASWKLLPAELVPVADTGEVRALELDVLETTRFLLAVVGELIPGDMVPLPERVLLVLLLSGLMGGRLSSVIGDDTPKFERADRLAVPPLIEADPELDLELEVEDVIVDEVTGRDGESGRCSLGRPSSSVVEIVLFRV